VGDGGATRRPNCARERPAGGLNRKRPW